MLPEIVDNKGEFHRRVKYAREGIYRCVAGGGKLPCKVGSKELGIKSRLQIPECSLERLCQVKGTVPAAEAQW